MEKFDDAREKLDDAIEAAPDDVQDAAKKAVQSAKQAAENAAKLGQTAVGEAGSAARKVVTVGQRNDDADPTDAHQQEYAIRDDEDD